jgi:hypothetical protein
MLLFLKAKNGLRWFGEEYPAEAFAKGGNSDEHQEVSSSHRLFYCTKGG